MPDDKVTVAVSRDMFVSLYAVCLWVCSTNIKLNLACNFASDQLRKWILHFTVSVNTISSTKRTIQLLNM
jgi:hypothetical protein